MYLSEVQIFNYKSFLDSGVIRLRPGFNIIIGQNNAGKTALLEALSLRFSSKPHRGLTKQSASDEPYSYVFATVSVEKEKVLSDLRCSTSMDEPAFVPLPREKFLDFRSHAVFSNKIRNVKEFGLEFFAKGNGRVVPLYQCGMTGVEDSYFAMTVGQAIHGETIEATDLEEYLDRSKEEHPDAETIDISEDYGRRLSEMLYVFRAERLNISASEFRKEENLEPDASNLPRVLSTLSHTNPSRFRIYNSLVTRVFPQVKWIGFDFPEDKKVEIVVWSVDPDTERRDLAFSLSESGTGISQVLAMLYVVATSHSPRIILIDEPNSFLHPGALRSLIEILREHPQHQYILSTHAPEMISACNPSTMHALRRTPQGFTVLESVNAQEVSNLRALLLEIGSRPSDIFGAEGVLWVEGPTEQLCFPLIVRHFLQLPLAGVSIVGVLHTGDFDAKKDVRSVFRIYERLTQQGNALMPPSVAFIFDRELRSDEARKDVERQGQGRVHFLSRRTYENYLLHALAIASVLSDINQHTPFAQTNPSETDVSDWLALHNRDDKYYGKNGLNDPQRDIDAPKVLHDLFHDFSGNTIEYSKTSHSLSLTRWILANKPEELKELGDILTRVISAWRQRFAAGGS